MLDNNKISIINSEFFDFDFGKKEGEGDGTGLHAKNNEEILVKNCYFHDSIGPIGGGAYFKDI